MRLDKYLKVSRLIKRRTVANEACDNGLVTVNGKPARASYEVKEGDRISLRFGARTLTVEVLSVQETVRQSEAAALYRQYLTGCRPALLSPAPSAYTCATGRDGSMTNEFSIPAASHRLELTGREHLQRFRRGGCGALRRKRRHYDHLRRNPHRHRRESSYRQAVSGGRGTVCGRPHRLRVL